MGHLMLGITGVSWARIAGALCVLLTVAPAAASPLRLFGYGGRSPATGGTGVASTTDYESVLLNPAGLAHTHKRLTIGGLLGQVSLKIDDADVDTDLANGTVFGLSVPIGFGGALKDRVGFALGLYIPNETLNKVKSPFPGEPSFAILENAAHVIAIQLATGVKIDSNWSVGVGTRILASLRGAIDVQADSAGRFTTRSEQQLITDFAPVIGVRYRQSDTITWGVAVTGKSESSYDITVKSDLGVSVPITLPGLLMAGTPQYDPLTAAFEIGWRSSPSLLLSGYLAWEHWSAFPLPTEDPVVGGEPKQVQPDYHDTLVPKISAEWTLHAGHTRIELRGGYGFIMTPAPEQSGPQSFLDNHRHVLASGVGLSWPTAKFPLRIDTWVQFHVLQPRSHTKDAAAFTPSNPPPFDTVDTGGSIVAGGLTLGVDL
jgi:hypothetical protein